MRLRDPEQLKKHMRKKDFTQARLARYAGVSRQFIHMLVTTQERTTCTVEVARLIEEALGCIPGDLFDANVSPAKKQTAKKGVAA
jgi:DNA-binding Xre family transcriptional regulator